ncbi:MAG: hypothetical protein WD049_09285 [Candidatus Paceibacterota bacterium]
MQNMHRGAALLGVILFTAFAPIASGHNLHVLIEEQAGSADVVDVIFEHSPYLGKGTYNAPLNERGKTWVAALDGKTTALSTQSFVVVMRDHPAAALTTPIQRFASRNLSR